MTDVMSADPMEDLPEVVVHDLGGTIVGTASSSDQTTTYRPGSHSIETLVKDMPELQKLARFKFVKRAGIEGSPDVTQDHRRDLARAIQRNLDGPACAVLVTHGTDTMVGTAWFLELTIKSEKPIIVVGALRPSTAYGADGKSNLLCATLLAIDEQAQGRGIMIAIDHKIWSPRFTEKTGTASPAFSAIGPGHLGDFVDHRPKFFCEPCRPIGRHHFDLESKPLQKSPPAVEILAFYSDMPLEQCRGPFTRGVRGLVLAGVGCSSWSIEAGNVIAAEAQKGSVIIVASRQPQKGFTPNSEIYGLEALKGKYIAGGYLSPEKCLIELSLAIEHGLSFQEIRVIFEGTKPKTQHESRGQAEPS